MRSRLILIITAGTLLLAGCQTAVLQTALPSPTPSAIPPASTPLPAIIPGTSPAPPVSPTATATPSLSQALPEPSTSSAAACDSATGSIVTGNLYSTLLPDSLDFRIYLPPCYDQDPERRYPVLYLIHGVTYTDDQWDRLGVDETATRLIAAGEIAPFLIVMPRDRIWRQPENDPFGRALIEELIPWVDANYRTLPDRAYRAIGGLSRGAAWAIHLGLSQWEYFGIIGAHSLPVFLKDTDDLEIWLDALPPESLPRLYLDIGDHDRVDVLESAIWFEKLLTQRGIPHEWHLFPGFHVEQYWQEHLEQYLRFYARGW